MISNNSANSLANNSVDNNSTNVNNIIKVANVFCPDEIKVLNILNGRFTGNEKTQEELMRNQKIVSDILDNNKGLIEKFYNLLLQSKLAGKFFCDVGTLLEFIREIFLTLCETIEIDIYKHNEVKNSLVSYSGRENKSNKKISIDEILNKEEFETEVLATKTSMKFILNLLKKSNIGGIASLKIGDYILSFRRKKINNVDSNREDEIFKNDLFLLSQILTDTGFLETLNTTQKYIKTGFEDKLTGLYNRAYLKELPKSIKYGILFIDLDKFKPINDKYGHDAGDVVLQEISKIVKSFIRVVDIPSRYGGDEFLIAIPTNSVDDMENIKLRINEELEKKLFTFTNIHTKVEETFKVGATIGIAFTDGNNTIEETINSADCCVLKEKKGKNEIKDSIVRNIHVLSEEELKEFIFIFFNCLDYNGKCEILSQILTKNLSHKEKIDSVNVLMDNLTPEELDEIMKKRGYVKQI